jgi:hypothetical protein
MPRSWRTRSSSGRWRKSPSRRSKPIPPYRDYVVTELSEVYQAERERLVRSREHRRIGLVRELLAGIPVSEDELGLEGSAWRFAFTGCSSRSQTPDLRHPASFRAKPRFPVAWTNSRL